MSILKCNGKIFTLSSSIVVYNAIEAPTVTAALIYDGKSQSPAVTGYDIDVVKTGQE